ncbi:heterogeneous nuclear ribonucleoprotein 1 isoform X2 [Arachis hypogaea]|uniref:heterogeneous nuclear ribonucleoprotein 1 isoform X2 n=1 Tax=Arachis hypogaea TaxID=3818 RepID=UPI000DED6729|nr:heterogeneous nuclear ribonucleoprotein 1 isoform X2 [Arachis hypogaea]
MEQRKLVVLGIPWDVDTEGLREYMSKYGELEDCIVMKERSTGRSRGFGYVTFASVDDAKDVLSGEHVLGNRMLEVKVATPKEEMRAPAKKVTRIFVARIPQSVTEASFRSHFEKYGDITDLYMPKDQGSKMHRGIGFITFASADSVESLMAETHELGGSTVVVDRATPKDDDFKPVGRMPQGGYGAYNAYISAATRYAALGAPTLYDHPGPVFGRGEPSRGIGKKIFVGRLPPEATSEDLRQYFGRFGRILDVYVPRVALDSATPVDDASPSGNFMMNGVGSFGGYGGPMRTYGRMYGSLDFDDWGYGIPSGRPSRADWRYRPY